MGLKKNFIKILIIQEVERNELNKKFVGDVFDEHNQRHSQYYKLISF